MAGASKMSILHSVCVCVDLQLGAGLSSRYLEHQVQSVFMTFDLAFTGRITVLEQEQEVTSSVLNPLGQMFKPWSTLQTKTLWPTSPRY